MPIAVFFMAGTSAVIPLGAPVGAFINENVEIAFTAVISMPMTVDVPAPTAAAQPAIIQTSPMKLKAGGITVVPARFRSAAI